MRDSENKLIIDLSASITVEQAVKYLLGWSIDYQIIGSKEYYEPSVDELLTNMLEDAEADYEEATIAAISKESIENSCAILEKTKDYYHRAQTYHRDIIDELSKEQSDLRIDNTQAHNPALPYITTQSLKAWAFKKYKISIFASSIQNANAEKSPWLIPDPKDPNATYSWFIPARYFARQSQLEESNIKLTHDQLAKKVDVLLKQHHIYKRGKKEFLDPATIKKAFANVNLS